MKMQIIQILSLDFFLLLQFLTFWAEFCRIDLIDYFWQKADQIFAVDFKIARLPGFPQFLNHDRVHFARWTSGLFKVLTAEKLWNK